MWCLNLRPTIMPWAVLADKISPVVGTLLAGPCAKIATRSICRICDPLSGALWGLAVRKRAKSPVESSWFFHAVILIVSLGVGSPLSTLFIFGADEAWAKVVFGVAPFLVCIGTGYLGLVINRWLSVDG